MLVSVGISWADQAEFSPSEWSLNFTHSQETTPAGFHSLWDLCALKTADFTPNSLGRLWIQSAGTRTISAVIAAINVLKAFGDAARDYSPAALAAPRAQGGGGGERQVVTTQSSPSESLEVKWQCRLPQALIKKQGIWSLKSICAVYRGRYIFKN